MDTDPTMTHSEASVPRWRRFLPPLLVGLAAWVVAWPVIDGLSQNFLGIEQVDGYGTQWFYWVVGELWRSTGSLDLEDLQESSVVFFPYGKDIYSHTGSNLIDAFVAVPFRIIWGPVAGQHGPQRNAQRDAQRDARNCYVRAPQRHQAKATALGAIPRSL